MQRLSRLLPVFWFRRLKAVIGIMVFFVAVPVSDLSQIRLGLLFSFRIICYIDPRGRDTRSTSINIFLLLLLSLVFFFLFLSFIKDLNIPTLVGMQEAV